MPATQKSILKKFLPSFRQKRILGLNRRNVDYLLPFNSRSGFPQVDNKLTTKKICRENDIEVPETYAVIKHHGEARSLPEQIRHHSSFVIKPAAGSSGRGIMVINRDNDNESGDLVNDMVKLENLRYHILTILSGLYSLGGHPDQAIIEQRIKIHPVFEIFFLTGLPDIRIIIYHGVPAMAMVRLPTRASEGRANLHQGAIALGINAATGETFGGVQGNHAISLHPDTGRPLTSIRIPQWFELLKGSIKLGEALELGVVGVDYAIDVQSGPLVLEANARPGLSIQLANRCGLVPRFSFIDSQQPELLTAEEKMDLTENLAEM